MTTHVVIPAKVGIQITAVADCKVRWTPAFAGVTKKGAAR